MEAMNPMRGRCSWPFVRGARRICRLGVVLLLAAGPLSAGLVSHWRLDEMGGTTAGDSAGANAGTLSGSVSFTGAGGVAGGALSCSGGQVTIPATALAVIEPADRVSVSLWVYPTSLAASYNTVFDTAGRQLSLWIESATVGWIGVGGSSLGLAFNPAWTVNEWQHLVLTYDASVARVYRNGILAGSVTLNGGSFSQAWVFGGNPSGGGSPWAGLMDDIQLYSQTLTPAEIVVLYNNPGRPLPEPAAASLWLAAALAWRRRRRPRR
jgi:hypothetical protein